MPLIARRVSVPRLHRDDASRSRSPPGPRSGRAHLLGRSAQPTAGGQDHPCADLGRIRLLAIAHDAWVSRVVVLSIGDALHANLVSTALNMASAQRRPHGVIRQSDQGKRGKEMDVRQSMGGVGNAHDNCMSERFLATHECELLNRRTFRPKAQARTWVFAFNEGSNDPRRGQRNLGHSAPKVFERRCA